MARNEHLPQIIADIVHAASAQVPEMPKHTPGPWSLGTTCDHTPAVTAPVPPSEGSGFVVAHINRLPRMGSVRGDMEANARLIAAAPEMLAALKASEAEYGDLDEDAPQDSGCIECTVGTVPNHLNTGLCAHHLRVAVIRKAEGRS